MLRSKFLSLLGLLAIGGAGAMYGFAGTKPVSKAASCPCCVAAGCTGEGCNCPCDGNCGDSCQSCADCCGACPGCATSTAAVKTEAVKPAAACGTSCCSKTAAK